MSQTEGVKGLKRFIFQSQIIVFIITFMTMKYIFKNRKQKLYGSRKAFRLILHLNKNLMQSFYFITEYTLHENIGKFIFYFSVV